MNTKNIVITLALLVVIGVVVIFVMGGNDKTQTNSKEFPERPQQNQEMTSDELVEDISDTLLSGELDEYEELTFPNNTLDTSDWVTYRNEEFGFEVRYPSAWDITTRTKEEIQEINPSMSFSNSFIGSVGFDTHEPYSGISIMVYNQNIETLVEDRGWTHFKDPGPGQTIKARINNIDAYYFLRKEMDEIYPGVYFLGDSGRGFEITHTTSDDNEKAFQQILLSFKLIK